MLYLYCFPFLRSDQGQRYFSIPKSFRITREAEARAKATLAQAEAEAKAIQLKLEAEAEGKKRSLLAEAEGFEAMVKAAESNPADR